MHAYFATVVQREQVVQQRLHALRLAAQLPRHDPGDELHPVPDGRRQRQVRRGEVQRAEIDLQRVIIARPEENNSSR